jgi:hypothetical protein
MSRGVLVVIFTVAVVLLGASMANAEYNRKSVGMEESFVFGAYNRVIVVSTRGLEHDVDMTAGCCSVTIITSGGMTEPLVMGVDGQNELPKHFKMPSINFECNSSGVTVFW